jgi:hypothetical protein
VLALDERHGHLGDRHAGRMHAAHHVDLEAIAVGMNGGEVEPLEGASSKHAKARGAVVDGVSEHDARVRRATT